LQAHQPQVHDCPDDLHYQRHSAPEAAQHRSVRGAKKRLRATGENTDQVPQPHLGSILRDPAPQQAEQLPKSIQRFNQSHAICLSHL
jgi:hypothetical protein